MGEEPDAFWLGESWTKFIGHNVCRLQGGYHNDQLRKWQSCGRKITTDSFMYPVFISAKDPDFIEEIASLPGQYKVGVKKVVEYLKPMVENGLKSVLLFPTDVEKAYDNQVYYFLDKLPILKAIPIIRKAFPHLTIACDVCLCGILKSGLCYMLTKKKVLVDVNDSSDEEYEEPTQEQEMEMHGIDLRSTLVCLSELAVKYAKMGADIVAPSDMNDGRVSAIDKALRWYSLRSKCSVMSYSAKFASCMYGPFRGACDSTPMFGNRKGSQLPPGSSGLASRAVARDVNENADIVMVKPAMMYLDVVRDIKQNHPNHPIAAYQVSGEYSMIRTSAENGIFDLKTMLYENFECMQRAGVDIIISYFTPTVLQWLKDDEKSETDNLSKLMKKLKAKNLPETNSKDTN